MKPSPLHPFTHFDDQPSILRLTRNFFFPSCFSFFSGSNPPLQCFCLCLYHLSFCLCPPFVLHNHFSVNNTPETIMVLCIIYLHFLPVSYCSDSIFVPTAKWFGHCATELKQLFIYLHFPEKDKIKKMMFPSKKVLEPHKV